jgi:hypothetical protein
VGLGGGCFRKESFFLRDFGRFLSKKFNEKTLLFCLIFLLDFLLDFT